MPFANVGVDGFGGDAWAECAAECAAEPTAAVDFVIGSAAASSLGGLSSVECGDARSDSDTAGAGAGGWLTEMVGVGVREEGREDLFS